jgi:hypothetical protein
MRLIVEYHVGDGCTFECDTTVPVVYESAEAFLVHFEEICHARIHMNWREHHFTLGGQEFNADFFFFEGKFQAPDIMTVDEFFAKVEI